MASIRERLIDIISDQLGIAKEQLKDETRFADDLSADSLDEVELVMEVEDEFDIMIADKLAEKVKTIGDAVTLVEKLSAAK